MLPPKKPEPCVLLAYGSGSKTMGISTLNEMKFWCFWQLHTLSYQPIQLFRLLWHWGRQAIGRPSLYWAAVYPGTPAYWIYLNVTWKGFEPATPGKKAWTEKANWDAALKPSTLLTRPRRAVARHGCWDTHPYVGPWPHWTGDGLGHWAQKALSAQGAHWAEKLHRVEL